MNTLRSWWADSRGKVIVVLFILWISALIHQFQLLSLLYPLTAVIFTVAIDILITRLRLGKDIFSLSSVVTGLLIGLILDPNSGALPLIFACIVAVFFKQFLGRGSHKHVFNPAAVGLVVSSLILGNHIAWWAASWGIVPAIILVIGMVPILIRLHRLLLPTAFLIVYFVMLSFSTSLSAAFHLTLDGTVFLFAFVMLPEPMTSTISGNWRYGWGIFVGAFVVLQNILRVSWLDPLLVALLGANVVRFFLIRTH